MLTCQEAIAIVGDYLEAALGPALALDLERHLDECDECTAYLNTYRASRELVAAAGWTDMPPALRARLREFLITRLSASRPSV
jgi:hypothetical protein